MSKDEQGQVRTRPWFEDLRVKRSKLDDLVRSFGDPLTGERAVPQDGQPSTANGARPAAKLSRARISDFSAEGTQDVLTKTDWAIMTPENPNGKPATDNRKATQPLESDLKKGVYEYRKVVGRQSDRRTSAPSWSAALTSTRGCCRALEVVGVLQGIVLMRDRPPVLDRSRFVANFHVVHYPKRADKLPG